MGKVSFQLRQRTKAFKRGRIADNENGVQKLGNVLQWIRLPPPQTGDDLYDMQLGEQRRRQVLRMPRLTAVMAEVEISAEHFA